MTNQPNDEFFNEVERLFTKNNKSYSETATKQELDKNESNSKTYSDINCSNAKKRFNFKGRINKAEGLLMFIVTVAVVCILCICIQINNVKNKNTLISEINNLETQVKSLQNQLDSVENKLELYITEENSKPINITLNIDGVETDLVYDPNTGTTNNNSTSSNEQNEDFDKSPFFGISFVDDENDTSTGIPIDSIYQYSPAYFAGLRAGDILLSMNNQQVSNKSDLDVVMSGLTAEDTVEIQFITITENGTPKIVNATQQLTYRGNFDLDD